MEVHGVVGRHIVQVRVGHSERVMDVIRIMERRRYMCSIWIEFEIHEVVRTQQ